MPKAAALALLLSVLALPASAHVSEQGLVLLLPTEHYITSGVLSVLASILLISAAPKRWTEALFRPLFWPLRWRARAVPDGVAMAVSLLSLGCFAALVAIGFAGPRDPLTNLLPLVIWTGLWITLYVVVGICGDLWRYLNPWTGLYALLLRGSAPMLRLPERLEAWPGVAVFMAFSLFYVVDIAPLDPDRLARIVAVYWAVIFAGMVIFGAGFLQRAEAFTLLFQLIARVSPFGAAHRGLGLPGWDLLAAKPLPLSLGVLALCALGMGSFDGLKETFWWLGLIGVNPLEFPGRSAVMVSSTLGLLAATLGLALVFSAALWLGERLARDGTAAPLPLTEMLRHFAPTVLPIALAYHASHFLVSFMVDGQYLLASLGDPLAQGHNYLGLGDIRVTTGFLNTADSVRRIWLTQAGIVVFGHSLAVLVSHGIALRLFETPRRAALSQIPLAAFMIAFTLFGLWLLASPRGM